MVVASSLLKQFLGMLVTYCRHCASSLGRSRRGSQINPAAVWTVSVGQCKFETSAVQDFKGSELGQKNTPCHSVLLSFPAHNIQGKPERARNT